MKYVSGIISTLIVMPIWYYLFYKILVAIEASELMFFLYWIYLPAGILIKVIDTVIRESEKQ